MAAALNMREQLAGKTVVGVLSGGNLNLRELGKILEDVALSEKIQEGLKSKPTTTEDVELILRGKE